MYFHLTERNYIHLGSLAEVKRCASVTETGPRDPDHTDTLSTRVPREPCYKSHPAGQHMARLGMSPGFEQMPAYGKAGNVTTV